ncbi:MAG: LCP family protein [Thermaerobacter sp.]|nr:LCP family protein [Thermaerobacter sp.]
MDGQKRTVRRRFRPGRMLAVLAGLLVLGGSIVAAKTFLEPLGAFGTPTKNASPQYHQFAFRHRITILLMGSSLQTAANGTLITNKNARNRTDTMILLSIDPTTKQVGVLSIPRDTLVNLPGVGVTKIAEAAYVGGLPEAVQVVQSTFHVPVDYYAYLSMFQFPKLINDMGGLVVDVPHPEVYQPSGGKLGIDLKAGVQRLNGWQVLAFTRFRQTQQGDISRIQQQQTVLQDIAHQLLQPKNIPLIPKLVGDFSNMVNTNMSTPQMLSLALFSKQINLSTIRYGTVPGMATQNHDALLSGVLDNWTMSQHLTSVVIQNVLLAQQLTATQKKSLKIYVASGTSSLAPANALAQQLTKSGYTVVGVGWANTHTHQRTVILNTTGDKWLDTSLQQMVGSSVVQFTAYHTTPWDLKITVGSDYTAPTGGSSSSGG